MVEYTNSRIREIIAEYIHNQRDRSILEDRYIDGMTLEKLAEAHEMSVSQIKRILYKGSETVFRHLPLK